MGFKDRGFHSAFFVPNVMDWGIEDTKDNPIEKDVDGQTRRIDEYDAMLLERSHQARQF